jgi:segregation and condensation protein B
MRRQFLGAPFLRMSLKAKIEAVIYAADEPVTLVQLAALFADEALQQRAVRISSQSPEPVAESALDPIGEATDDGKRSDLADAESIHSRPTGETPTEERAEISTPSESDPPAATDFALESVSTFPPLAEQEPPTLIPEPVDEKRLARQRDREVRDELRLILAALIDEYSSSDRGMEIREIAGGYRVATKPEYHDAVRGFVKSLKPPMKLSLQALETLAVIAYKQPVTGPEVSEIRGVDSGGVLGSLISRKLITTAGRKQVIGRPILYKTTREFLLRFGLNDVSELPSIEEFEKMAGELAETDAETEAASAPNDARLPFTGMSDASEGFPDAPSAIEEADAIHESDLEAAPAAALEIPSMAKEAQADDISVTPADRSDHSDTSDHSATSDQAEQAEGELTAATHETPERDA